MLEKERVGSIEGPSREGKGERKGVAGTLKEWGAYLRRNREELLGRGSCSYQVENYKSERVTATKAPKSFTSSPFYSSSIISFSLPD